MRHPAPAGGKPAGDASAYPRGAGGASGVIFGLLAMTIIWAPKNELSILCIVWYLLRARVFVFEITFLTFGIYFLGFEVLKTLISGLEMSSELLHVNGAFVGAVAGVGLLQLDLVDCEKWDLFSVMRGEHGATAHVGKTILPYVQKYSSPTHEIATPSFDKNESKEPLSEEEKLFSEENVTERREQSLQKIRRLLKAGKSFAALTEHQKIAWLDERWRLGGRELEMLASGLYSQQYWSEAGELFEQFLELHANSKPANGVRVKLAGILVQHRSRPRAAVELLRKVELQALSEKQKAFARKILQRARTMIDEGVVEQDGQDWS